MKRLIAILILLAGAALAQNTTTISGVISDLSGVPVTSGQLTFSLKPSADSTISGVARFTPQTIVCGIDGTGAVKNQSLSGACTVTKTTALTPSGMYYHVDICPSFACTSSFNMFATSTSLDISTVSPTPASAPNYGVVDLTSTQTITGAKTFTGTVTFSGTFPSLAATAISSGTFSSTAANSAASGLVNAANNACIAAARNAGNSADVCTIKLNTSNQVVLGTSFVVPAVADQAVGRATTDTLTNKTLTSPTISGGTISSPTITTPTVTSPTINGGIANNGSGFKHARVASCTTAASANGSCSANVTWASAFADTNYTVTCQNSAGTAAFVGHTNKAAALVAYLLINEPGNSAATAGTIECIAVHD